MKNCTYSISLYGLDIILDELQLILFMHLNGIDSIEKLKLLNILGHAELLREELSKPQIVIKLIRRALDNSLELTNSTLLGNDYAYLNGAISVLDFIDEHRIPAWEGQMNVRMKIDPNELVDYYIETEGKDRELAIKDVEKMQANWDLISNNGRIFHALVQDFARLNMEYTRDEDLRNAFFNLLSRKGYISLFKDSNTIDKLYNTLKNSQIQIATLLKGLRPDDWANTRILGGHLYGVARTSEGTNVKLGCHLDDIYIDKEGNVHVFNYKITTHSPKEWSVNMDTKYSYEMAFILKMLEAAGINAKSISMYNIPIVLTYTEEDGKYGKIESVLPGRKGDLDYIPYAIRNNKPYLYQFTEQIKDVILPLPKTEEEKNEEDEYMFKIKTDINIETPNMFLSAMMPIYNALAKGMLISAKNWIAKHTNCGDIYFDPDREQWKIVFNEDNIKYVDNKEDILNCVLENISLVQDGEPVVVSLLLDELINNYATKNFTFHNRRGFNFAASYAQKSFLMYLNYNDKGEHEWQLVTTGNEAGDVLWQCGILMFRNKNTQQVDIVIPSGFDVNELIKTKAGANNILGYYESDVNSPTNMMATYGNVEIIRALAVINELLGKNILKDCKFGNILVITPHHTGDGLVRSFKEVVPHFTKITNYLTSKGILTDYKNNFNKISMMESSELLYNLILKIESNDIITNYTKSVIKNNLGLDSIDNISTNEAIAMKLIEIVKSIEGSLLTDNSSRILELRTSGNEELKLLALLWMDCIDSINHFNGMYSPEVKYIPTWKRLGLPQYSNPDSNVRYIANLYTRALDNIAVRFLKEYSPIRDKILSFYDKQGFTKFKSSIYGSAEDVYKKMFQYDLETGKNLFKFVNPYNNVSSINLNEEEKNFLKFALYQLNRTKFRGLTGKEFPYSSPNDPELVKLMTSPELSKDAENYLLVPLEKGSVLHLNRRSLSQRTEHYKTEISKLKSLGTEEYLKLRFQERLLQTEFSDGSEYEEDVSRMSVHNSLLASYQPDVRRRMMSLHEDSYFETNIEYLLIDSLEKQIQTEELNNVAFLGKCLLAKMHILGDVQGEKSKKIISESVNEVTKFLKLNVFGKSIMESSSQAILEMIDPARKFMSHMLIAFNLRSAFRDTFEGVWQNYVRTFSKYQTDLKANFVRQGYEKVIKDIFQSDRDIDILSELCLRYRLSNTDSAKISERAKTGRGGIFNPGYWGYSTLRGPDFLNRMTLFVARCLQDGVWEAYNISSSHELTYDCKRDGRFKAFFEGKDPKSEEYKIAKSKYYAAVSLYNKEHPNNTISFNYNELPLPEPYSLLEIEQFKMFANGIYGAYDKSLRAMYENLALGKTFGVFSTWLNGLVAAYFREPGRYYEYFETTGADDKPIIKKDEYSGNELWFDHDGNICEKTPDGKFIDDKGNEITENLELFVPVLDRIPVTVQGIFYTLGTSIKILFSPDGGYEEFKKRVLNNKYERANLKKMAWDLFMWMFFAALFGLILTPAYKKHLKECDNLAENMMCELLFKSSSSSYDGFQGPFAITKYILNDVNASAPNVSIKIVSDACKTVFGEKTWNSFLYSNVPVWRTFKQSAQIANPKSFRVTD